MRWQPTWRVLIRSPSTCSWPGQEIDAASGCALNPPSLRRILFVVSTALEGRLCERGVSTHSYYTQRFRIERRLKFEQTRFQQMPINIRPFKRRGNPFATPSGFFPVRRCRLGLSSAFPGFLM